MLRKMEEEERVTRRKRKWSVFRSGEKEMRIAKDSRNVKDSKVVASLVDVSKSVKFTEGGSDLEGGNYSEGGTVVGVRQPMSNLICERSLSLSTPDILKYGTSQENSTSSMGPESTAANLVVESTNIQMKGIVVQPD